MIRTIIAVGLGGFAGSVLRYMVSRATADVHFLSLAIGTLTVNLAGSLLLGFITAVFLRSHGGSEYLRLFLTVGICGGFTTFSTFMGENFSLVRSGQILETALYLVLSVVFGFLLYSIGYMAASRL